ncbi:hypothetical protein [Mycobacterium marinum]
MADYAMSTSSSMRLNDWRLEFDFPVGEFISDSWNNYRGTGKLGHRAM